MPKINDRVASMVLRKGMPTEDEWRKLILHRSESISILLDSVSVPNLWQFEFAQSDMKTPLTLEVFKEDIPNDSTSERLSQQGIYASRSFREHPRLIWGFTRKNYWLSCEVREETRGARRHITAIGVAEDRDPAFLERFGVTYYDMWKLLSSPLPAWIERRRRQLETLHEYEANMRYEDMLIDVLRGHRGD